MRTLNIALIILAVLAIGIGSLLYYGPTIFQKKLDLHSQFSSSIEWDEVVELLIASSKKLEIELYSTGDKASIGGDDPLFKEILSFFEAASIRRAQSKTVTIENTTVYVTIPYTYGWFLTFELNNGSKLWFDLVEDTIWFETKSTIYEVGVSSDLLNLIEEVVSKNSTSPFKQEVYEEGLNLIVTLNALELRAGDNLTINVILLNVNNTANITFAASFGRITLRVSDSSGKMVYGIEMVAPGTTAPYPILEPGGKISDVFRWDTSKNFLNGDKPPSPGKYYVDVEASVTDLDTYTEIILRIDRIELNLLS